MFKDRIREHYDDLTPGFRKLADFIMTNTLDVAFLTATRLSRRVGVDPATVVRFSQEIGYSGYRELSREIKDYVRDQVTSTYREAEDATTVEGLLRSLVQNTQQNFEHFVTTDLSNVGEAVELLKEAPHVWIVAEHMGYDLANFMAKNLQDLGISSSAFYPSMSETASVISQMKDGEILLALVNEGPSIDAGYAVKLAKDKGIKTLCLTGSGVALPAREADLAIIVPIKTPAGVPSFGAEMLVLSIMWEALASSLEEQTADNLKTRRDNMAKILKVRAETPEYEVSSPHDIWGDHLPTE